MRTSDELDQDGSSLNLDRFCCAAPGVSRRSPVSGLAACSAMHASEAISYKPDSLAFTNVNWSMAMAIRSNPGIHSNKERQMRARPRANLSDP